MKATNPPDAYKGAAVRVFSNVSLKITERIESWDFALGSEIVNKLLEFLRINRDGLGDHIFGFELSQADFPAGDVITPKFIIKENVDTPKLITLDQKLRLIKSVPLELDSKIASGVTFSAVSANTVVAEYESKSVVNFYANGFWVASESLDALGSLPARRGKFARRGEDYELAIRDHYRNQVKYWQQTDHWEDRKNRILRKRLGSSTNTEDIFHRSLLQWLNLHLDAQVRSKPRTVESDEPDIEVISFGGKFFVIEVKWLGTSGDSPYLIPRLIQGFGQLGTYLNKQTTVNKGTLVVYDGRKREDFDALNACETPEDGCVLIDECNGTSLHPRGSCVTLFLENKTASD